MPSLINSCRKQHRNDHFTVDSMSLVFEIILRYNLNFCATSLDDCPELLKRGRKPGRAKTEGFKELRTCPQEDYGTQTPSFFIPQPQNEQH